nr:ribonuclease HIII [Listeria grayi]
MTVSKEKLGELHTYYQSFLLPKLPNGAVFAAKKNGITITAYKSGKVMFQGNLAEKEAAKWGTANTTASKAKPTIAGLPVNFAQKNVVGSDEVGTGDYFGPITVCAAYVSSEMMPQLTALGVRDSKDMRDPEILTVAEKIIPFVPHSVLICPNGKYNALQQSGMNQGKMKAILHNRAIENVLKKLAPLHPDAILIDQFAEKGVYYRYLANEPSIMRENVYFATKAEGHHLAVAAASIIARYRFVKAFEEIQQQVGLPLTKGAGAKVDAEAAEIIRRFGSEKLSQIAKLHFANTEKAKRLV